VARNEIIQFTLVLDYGGGFEYACEFEIFATHSQCGGGEE